MLKSRLFDPSLKFNNRRISVPNLQPGKIVTIPIQVADVGGLWDWFRLRLLRVMFKNGYKAEARHTMHEIATKIVRNKTFSEWDVRDGTSQRSRDYQGAAGAVS